MSAVREPLPELETLSEAEAAALIGVKAKLLRTAALANECSVIHPGDGTRRYKRSFLAAWQERRTVQALPLRT